MFYANASENMFLLSGRLRISVKGLKGNVKLAERIHRLEVDAHGIKKALANVYTGNALILFDETATGAPDIAGLIEQAKYDAESDSNAYTAEAASPCLKTARDSRPLMLAGVGLAALGGACALIPHSLLGANGVLPGAAAISLGLPLAREGFVHWKKTRQLHYGLLLLPVALISLLIGRSSFGLLAVLMGTATSIFERLFGRHRIRSEPPVILKSTQRVYRRIAPVVLLAAGIYCLATGNLIVPLAMLVLAFPYMLDPAASVTMRRAVAEGAGRGIFVRDPSKLDECRRLTTVILGSDTILTRDCYRVESVIPADNYNKNRLVALAASCLANTDSLFTHALADEAKRRNIKLMPSVCLESAGYVCGMIDGEEVCFGTKTQLDGKYAFNTRLSMQEQKLLQLGQYPVFITYGSQIRGLMGFELGAKETGIEMLERLREAGIEDFWLFSQRDDSLAAFVAREFGIDRWSSNAAREDVSAAIQKMNDEGQSAAILCLNDCAYAPHADLVVCISNDGAECGQYADILLQSPEIMADAVDLAKYTSEKLAQNGIVSTGIDAVGLILLLTMNLSPYGALVYKTVGNGLLLAFALRSFRYFQLDKECDSACAKAYAY